MYHGVNSGGGSAAGEDNVEVVPAVFFFLRGPSVGPLTVFLVFFKVAYYRSSSNINTS